MFITTAQELQEKTLAYWHLSKVWNGKEETLVETGNAIEVCSTILDMTNFVRPLFHRTDILLQEIIRGEPSQPKEVPAKIEVLR